MVSVYSRADVLVNKLASGSNENGLSVTGLHQIVLGVLVVLVRVLLGGAHGNEGASNQVDVGNEILTGAEATTSEGIS